MASGNLWNYSRDEIDDVNDNVSAGKLLKYKTKIVERPERLSQTTTKFRWHSTTATSKTPSTNLKFWSHYSTEISSYLWRFFYLPLLNCEVQLDSTWTKDCVLIEHHNNIKKANFMTTSTKLYLPVVTFFINDNIKFLENLK